MEDKTNGKHQLYTRGNPPPHQVSTPDCAPRGRGIQRDGTPVRGGLVSETADVHNWRGRILQRTLQKVGSQPTYREPIFARHCVDCAFESWGQAQNQQLQSQHRLSAFVPQKL